MSARDEILGRLRDRVRPVEPPGPWRSRRQFDNLAGRFVVALQQAKGEVIRAADRADALVRLGSLLQTLNAQSGVADAALLDVVRPAERWPDVHWCLAGAAPPDSTFRSFCANADVGLTGADVALAETGSIVVSSGPGKSRLVALLPPVHIALVPTARLTTDLFTWIAAREGGMPAGFTIISGPSKTADIEQTMAVGVHGPKRFIVILYDEPAVVAGPHSTTPEGVS